MIEPAKKSQDLQRRGEEDAEERRLESKNKSKSKTKTQDEETPEASRGSKKPSRLILFNAGY